MATDVVMPQMGFDMKEGRVVRWLKQEGDSITRGESLAEIETDKAIVEVEAYDTGILRRIVVPEGETVPVGAVIGILAAADEDIPAVTPPPAAQPTPQPAVSAPPPPAKQASPAAPVAAPGERIPASPVARRIAEQEGIDLRQVEGTGPSGRITRADVEAAVAKRSATVVPAATPAPPAAERAPLAPPPDATAPDVGPVPAGLTPMRHAIARRMSIAKREIPHFYVTMDIDMSRAVATRRELNEDLDDASRVSINDMVVRACVKALEKYPGFNINVLAEGIVHHEKISISLAIALEQGLIAPALVDIASLSLPEIARRSKSLAERARSGGLRPEELSGGGFAISNMGMFGVSSFTAIITPPNGAAIAVGAVEDRAVVQDGQIVVAQMMSATVSADHRATDGAQAAVFLGEIKRFLENPVKLLV